MRFSFYFSFFRRKVASFFGFLFFGRKIVLVFRGLLFFGRKMKIIFGRFLTRGNLSFHEIGDFFTGRTLLIVNCLKEDIYADRTPVSCSYRNDINDGSIVRRWWYRSVVYSTSTRSASLQSTAAWFCRARCWRQNQLRRRYVCGTCCKRHVINYFLTR